MMNKINTLKLILSIFISAIFSSFASEQELKQSASEVSASDFQNIFFTVLKEHFDKVNKNSKPFVESIVSYAKKDKKSFERINSLIIECPALIWNEHKFPTRYSTYQKGYVIDYLCEYRPNEISLIEFFLQRGAKSTLNQDYKCVALGSAVFVGKLELVELLLIYGANPNLGFENKALHSIYPGDKDAYKIALLLLFYGADLNEIKYGKNVLEYFIDKYQEKAYRYKNYEKIKYLYMNWPKYGRLYKEYLINYKERQKNLLANSLIKLPEELIDLNLDYLNKIKTIPEDALSFESFVQMQLLYDE